MKPLAPRALLPDDDVTHFHSGEPSLDRYLAERALANQAAGYARCYVCLDAPDDRILGYYTLSAVAIERERVTAKARRNSPQPIPAVLLGRLAVDRQSHGRGLGRSLLRDAILSTLAAADSIGVRLLLVHALRPDVVSFSMRYGFQPSPTDPLHLALLLADARSTIATL